MLLAQKSCQSEIIHHWQENYTLVSLPARPVLSTEARTELGDCTAYLGRAAQQVWKKQACPWNQFSVCLYVIFTFNYMKYYWLLPISSNSWLKYAQVICLQDLNFQMAFQVLSRKESSCQGRRPRRRSFNPWVEKMPCKRKWQPAPIFLPKKFHGQRSWWATVMG